MASVLDHKSNVVLLGELDTRRDVLCLSRIDSIDRIVAQIALGVVLNPQRGIDSRTSLNGRVGISSWKLRQPGVDVEVITYVLAELLVVTGTRVTRFGNGLVEDELARECVVEGIPCCVRGPAVIDRGLLHQ